MSLFNRNRRVLQHEAETPMRGHDEDGSCCIRAALTPLVDEEDTRTQSLRKGDRLLVNGAIVTIVEVATGGSVTVAVESVADGAWGEPLGRRRC